MANKDITFCRFEGQTNNPSVGQLHKPICDVLCPHIYDRKQVGGMTDRLFLLIGGQKCQAVAILSNDDICFFHELKYFIIEKNLISFEHNNIYCCAAISLLLSLDYPYNKGKNADWYNKYWCVKMVCIILHHTENSLFLEHILCVVFIF